MMMVNDENALQLQIQQLASSTGPLSLANRNVVIGNSTTTTNNNNNNSTTTISNTTNRNSSTNNDITNHNSNTMINNTNNHRYPAAFQLHTIAQHKSSSPVFQLAPPPPRALANGLHQNHNHNHQNHENHHHHQRQPNPVNPVNNNPVNNNNRIVNNNINQQQSQANANAIANANANANSTTYNTLECCDYDYNALVLHDPESVTYHIAQQIEFALRQAKSAECLRQSSAAHCQVTIPCNLTLAIAEDILQMSETEPCGLRGCTLFINLEEKSSCQRIASFKFGDCYTVATFEMFLTLKRVPMNWLNNVSNRILKNFGRNSIVISDLYKLSKKKLYRTPSYSSY